MNDAPSYGDIEPNVLRSWLAVRGWRRLGKSDGEFTDWAAPAGATQIVRVVESVHLDDYPSRVASALFVLANLYDKPPEAIAADVMQSKMDRLEFRSVEDVDGAGAIQALGGIRFFDGINKILVAGAKAAKESRPYFGQKNWQYGKAFLESARLGQTNIGSYVVTVLSHAISVQRDELGQTQLPNFPHDDRFTMTRLVASLTATRDIVDLLVGNAHDNEAILFDGVSKGFSADLCDGLIKLGDSSSRSKVDITVQWSPLVEPFGDLPATISFGPDDLPTLLIARNALRGIKPERVTVAGFVDGLARPEGVRGGPGLISLRVRRGGRLPRNSRVRVALNADDHQRAIRAYELGILLDVRGDLAVVGNRRWIHNGVLFGQSLNRLDIPWETSGVT